ncbi:MAG TPA: outer membrane beta-barrel family protein [Sphingomicrobium sp.]|jgi:outer membrane receptor protein involved in Fe transport
MRTQSFALHCSIAALAMCLAAPAAAQAQASTPQPAPKAQAPQQGITVTGQRADVVTSADRISFNVSKDLQAQTGTVADMLRNVPGVEVDLQGNVSLRGDPSVKILIDGRPSSVLSGDNRGDALNAMPAGQIERVEVITNPSAAMSPEGSGGVLNLITKRGRQGSKSATAKATFGGFDRLGLSLTGSSSANGTTINGDVNFRNFANDASIVQLRTRRDPATGNFVDSRLEGDIENKFNARMGKLSIDRDLDKSNRVSAEVNVRRFSIEGDRDDIFQSDLAAASYSRHSDVDASNRGVTGKLSWRRTLPGKDHELVVDLMADKGSFRREQRAVTDFAVAPNSYETIRNAFDQRLFNPKVDYKRPIGETGSLNLGYEGEYSTSKFDFYGARGPAESALVELPALTNEFDYGERVHAFYGTYDFSLGKLETHAGLRLEQVGLDIDQVTDGTSFDQHYFRAYPTVHFNYSLPKDQQLRASYSRRIQRPSPQDLNPYIIYLDPQSVRRGNPFLKPEITDSFEFGWQKRKSPSFLSLTAFYRRSTGGITDVITDIGGGTFLNTRSNLATARRVGVDAILNGKLSKTLTYNASSTLLWNEIDTRQAGFEKRSGTSVSVRGNMTWQPTKKDMFQLNAVYNGKQLIPQGYRLSSAILNLGYRRTINDRLNFTVSGQDVLSTGRQKLVVEGTDFRDRLTARGSGRTILFSLGYNWGKESKRKDAGFEFQQQGGGDIAQ